MSSDSAADRVVVAAAAVVHNSPVAVADMAADRTVDCIAGGVGRIVVDSVVVVASSPVQF